jgi:dihydroorotate dehydrogenase electron transfer subunit
MSVSFIDKDIKAITFRNIGEATSALFQLVQHEKIGIRGPYGNGFSLKGKELLFVGGGTGIAMLAPAIEQACMKNISPTAILGLKTKNEIFFEKRLRSTGANILFCTDDGSKGYKGFASDLARETLEQKTFDGVLTCGPEVMMKELFQSCKHLPFQASLERYMKCAIGICGQCCVGNGLRVCVDGPVFDGKTLKNIEDFGVFKRDSAGRKVKL